MPAFPPGRVVGAAALGVLGVPHGQQQFSGSSTGSTQRRDQAKARDVVISPGAGRSLGHGFGQKDLPRQAFMGYSGRMAEAT